MNEEDSVIILNRMYVGDYLGENLGHEVINLIKSDNGNHYIYVNAHGTVNEEFYRRDDEIVKNDVILLTRLVNISGIKDTVEILAKATGCELCAKKEMEELFGDKEDYKKQDKLIKAKKRHKINKDYIKEKDIRYGGVLLNEIFANNDYAGRTNDSAMFVTYKVDKIVKPKKRIYISTEDLSNEKDDLGKVNKDAKNILEKDEQGNKIGKVFWLNENSNKDDNKDKDKYKPCGTELKTYFTTKKEHAFENLKKIINTPENWENDTIEEKTKDILENYKPQEHNLIDIIHKTRDELTYSNLLAYMLMQEPLKKSFCEFFSKFGVENLSKNYVVTREEGNIDILIQDDENIIVIENKIKSAINGWKTENKNSESATNQLHKYMHYVYGEVWDKNKSCYKKVEETDKKYLSIKKFQDELKSQEEAKTQEEAKKRKRHFLVLKPKYNNLSETSINEEIENFEDKNVKNSGIERKGEYKIISYADLYNHFKDIECNAMYFKEFKSAIERHSYDVDNIQEHQMFERFVEIIKKSSDTGKK